MTDKTVTLQGTLLVPADARDAVRAALPDHIRLTRAEPGCLQFDVDEDPARPGVFHVSERFRDTAAFEAHQTRAQASEWARVTEGMTRDYRVTGLDT